MILHVVVPCYYIFVYIELKLIKPVEIFQGILYCVSFFQRVYDDDVSQIPIAFTPKQLD